MNDFEFAPVEDVRTNTDFAVLLEFLLDRISEMNL